MEARKGPGATAHLVVPSRADEVPKIRKVVGALSRSNGFTEDEVSCIEVAVGEGVANAVRHGSPHGEDDLVEVVYEHVADSHVEISIQDRGNGFDLEKWLEEIVPLSLSDGERGLLLIATLMDKISYHRTRKGGLLSFRKYLPRANAATEEESLSMTFSGRGGPAAGKSRIPGLEKKPTTEKTGGLQAA